MDITARSEYAIRAMAELTARGEAPTSRAELASAQAIPGKFLEAILGDLRRGGLVRAQRGAAGGYRLAKPATEIALADIVRAVDGPLAGVRGEAPESLHYAGAAAALREVWIAMRAAMRGVLERTSLQDLVDDRLPEDVRALLAQEGAWARR